MPQNLRHTPKKTLRNIHQPVPIVSASNASNANNGPGQVHQVQQVQPSLLKKSFQYGGTHQHGANGTTVHQLNTQMSQMNFPQMQGNVMQGNVGRLVGPVRFSQLRWRKTQEPRHQEEY